MGGGPVLALYTYKVVKKVFPINTNFMVSIFGTWWWDPFIFQTIWSNRIHSLKYEKSVTLVCTDISVKKSEFEAKTPSHTQKLTWLYRNKVLICHSIATNESLINLFYFKFKNIESNKKSIDWAIWHISS